jgi:DNA-binding transcriptional MerR regulator
MANSRKHSRGQSLTARVSSATQQESDTVRVISQGADGAQDMDDEIPDAGTRDAIVRSRSSSVVATTLATYRRRRGGGGSGGSGSGGSSRKKGLLSEAELDEIESTYAEGITAVQVVEIFTSRDVRLSEASFRKYVQLGLLPRSRRVGRKGKHRGSMGVYPAKTVRRINEIKRLMADGYTIEEIEAQFLRFTDALETLEEGFSEFFSHLENEAAGPRFDNQTRRSIRRELSEARKTADDLLARLDDLSRRVGAPQGDQYRSAGAAGSAEDLL